MMYHNNEEDAHSDGEMFESPVDIHSQALGNYENIGDAVQATKIYLLFPRWRGVYASRVSSKTELPLISFFS